jgi:hypothetical protein
VVGQAAQDGTGQQLRSGAGAAKAFQGAAGAATAFQSSAGGAAAFKGTAVAFREAAGAATADTSFSDFPPLLAPRPGGETCLKNSRLMDLGEVSFLLVPLMEPLEWPIHPVPQP